MKILITGGAGFIGHHFIEEIMKNKPDWEIVVIDKLNYASKGFDRLREIQAYNKKDITLLSMDLTKRFTEGVKSEIGEVDYIVHLAASTHVQRSIENPEPFVMDNVLGTFYLLEFARELKSLKKFINFSTDEAYGDAPPGIVYREDDRLNPKNPYAATKCAGEMLVNAYINTYGVPAITTYSMNVFGERQHPEKYVPLCINKILKGEELEIHYNIKTGKPGSRFWIHARNSSNAVLYLLEKGIVGERYNIAPPDELDNLEIAQLISRLLKKPLKYKMVDWHSTRPGHDPRYALDGSKLARLGWVMPMDFESSFAKTVEWCVKDENKHWLEE
jgi:dTDP-glucose 4,6-dehydratase